MRRGGRQQGVIRFNGCRHPAQVVAGVKPSGYFSITLSSVHHVCLGVVVGNVLHQKAPLLGRRTVAALPVEQERKACLAQKCQYRGCRAWHGGDESGGAGSGVRCSLFFTLAFSYWSPVLPSRRKPTMIYSSSTSPGTIKVCALFLPKYSY